MHEVKSTSFSVSSDVSAPPGLPYGNIVPAGGDTATPLNLEKRLRVIERYSVIRGKRVLDCGCGAGDYVRALQRLGGDAWGIEFSRDKLATAPREVSGRLSVGDLHHIAIRDGAIDVALMNEVLEHVPDDGQALREVHRVLKPGGTLLIFSPNRRYPFETHGAHFKRSGRRIPHYVPLIPYVPLPLATIIMDFWARNYWPTELRRLVRSTGFTIAHTDYVWQTFEGISNHQPAFIAQTRGLLRTISSSLERVPLLRTLGVSQVIVARRAE
jgi:ubiquinone/menaquinone biosynthesis C-methylase UbiE